MPGRRYTQREWEIFNEGHATGASKSTKKKTKEIQEIIDELCDDVRFSDHDRPNDAWDETRHILRTRLSDLLH